MGLSAAAYVRSLKQLLPPGSLWNFEQDSILSKLLLGLSDELARVDARAEDLVNESDPRTATETLAEWERVLGLPDSAIVSIPATDAARRLAITQKLTKRAEQNAAFFIALAGACGYTVTIDDSYGASITRSGAMRSGDRVTNTDSAFYWTVTVQPPSGTALSHAELEAIIRRAAPIHTTVVFNYL